MRVGADGTSKHIEILDKGLLTIENDTDAQEESDSIARSGYINKEYNRAKIKQIESVLLDRRTNRKIRVKYSKVVLCYLVCYSIFVAILLILQGFNMWDFSLPKNALNFLVGSTAAAAIGLVYSVTNGLFGKNIDLN